MKLTRGFEVIHSEGQRGLDSHFFSSQAQTYQNSPHHKQARRLRRLRWRRIAGRGIQGHKREGREIPSLSALRRRVAPGVNCEPVQGFHPRENVPR